MIQRIYKSRSIENLSQKVYKTFTKERKLPIVKKPIVLNMLMMEPPRLEAETVFEKWCRLRKEKKLEKQRLIEYEKEQEALRQKRLAEQRARELERQRQMEIEAERARLAELEKQKALEIQEQELYDELEDFEEEEEYYTPTYNWESHIKTKPTKLELVRDSLDNAREVISKPFVQVKEYVSDKIYEAKYDLKYSVIPKVSEITNKTLTQTRENISDKLQDIKETVKYDVAPKISKATSLVLTKTQEFASAKVEQVEDMYKLLQAKKQFFTKLQSYKKFASDFAYMEPFNGWQLANIGELRSLESVLNEEINRAVMINRLKVGLTKGADSYMPDSWKFDFNTMRFINIKSKNIEQDDDTAYRIELKRLCNIFEQNSAIVESAIITFNKLVSSFFKQSSMSIKEIFNLQKNSTNRWLERIPKLGFIPKFLRISEQIALTNCIMKDYKDISSKYVKQIILPYFREYDSQYEEIKNFVNRNKKKQSAEDKIFTDSILEKISSIKERRDRSNANNIRAFTNGGMNISNICKNVRMRGSIELITKTVSTFMPFF